MNRDPIMPLPPGWTRRPVRPPAPPVTADEAQVVAAVLGLAEEWRYKGEFGWGPWQEGYGPDQEGSVRDECSSRLRATVAAVLAADPESGYTVELGGQVFTQAQWEALQPYIEARIHADSDDAATWTADPEPRAETVERVARAMWNALPATPYGWDGAVKFDPPTAAHYRRLAAAALDAEEGRP